MGYFFLLPAADCAAFIKSLAKHLSVNEMVRPVIEDLFAFMPFAGNEDDVFSVSGKNGTMNRLAAVNNGHCPLISTRYSLYALHDRIDNRLRIFRPRIVTRNDDLIGKPCGTKPCNVFWKN